MSMFNTISRRAKSEPKRAAMILTVIAAVAAAIAVGAIFLLRDDSQASAQSANQFDFQVQRGSITTSISIGGTSIFPVKEEVSFEAVGTVDDVLIAAGDTVSEGDVLASFDAATVAALKVTQTAAEAAASEAQAVYDIAASGATTRAEVAAAQESVALAELAVTAAQDALFDVSAAVGVDGEVVTAAREAVSFATRDVEAATAALDDVMTSEALSELDTAIEDAEADYRDVLMRWLGAVPDGYETMTFDEILEAWEVTLTEIYTTYAVTHLDSETPWVDDDETPWNEVVVWTWTSMSLNAVDTEAASSPHALILAPRGEVESAWSALEKARDEYVAQGLADTAAALAAEKTVSKAEGDLASAQADLTALLEPALLASRQAALDRTTAELDEAVITLEQARDNADAIMNEADSKLELALQDLADASDALASSTLISPISGTVLAVNIEPGDSVTRTTVVAEIADTSIIAVESSVDEEDILSIQLGLPVIISLDAVTGRTFSGTVTAIGQAEQSQQGAVSFPVEVTLDDTADLELVEGLTASAEVINSQVADVLIVPVAAVGGTIFEPSVERTTNQGSETVLVQLGSSNGTFVEVQSGVSEGDTVVATIAGQVGLPTNDNLPFVPGGGFGGRIPGQGGGGFGGGAGGRGGN